jgi:hypothetical protein
MLNFLLKVLSLLALIFLELSDILLKLSDDLFRLKCQLTHHFPYVIAIVLRFEWAINPAFASHILCKFLDLPSVTNHSTLQFYNSFYDYLLKNLMSVSII